MSPLPTQEEILDDIERGLGRSTPTEDLITKMRQFSSLGDHRVDRGADLMRVLLAGGADRLELFYRNIDPQPWRTISELVSDVMAVVGRRAAAMPVKTDLHDL